MGEWPVFTTKRLIDSGLLEIGDGYRAKNSEMGENGLPFVRAGDVDGRVNMIGTDILSADSVERVGPKRSRAGDVVITTKGTVGRVAFVKDGDPVFVYSPQLCYWRSNDWNKIIPRWLFFALQSNELKHQMGWSADQTDMAPYISLTDQRSAFHLTLPPPEEQRAIAEILGALDDKIELNRRTNETLEALTRAIFKDWFVDFGPTRAKAEGRAPYLAPELWELFPDALDDEDKPEGWEYQQLQTLADVHWGDTKTTKKSYTEEGYTAFSASGPDGLLPYHDFERVGVVLSAIGANCGLTWLAYGKWSCIKNTIRFWSTLESVPTEYLYLATHGKHFWPKRGSVQPFISQTDARNLKVLLSSTEILQRFGALVRPLYDKVDQNDKETNALAQTRDLLLPKLMSGEIRLRDAEKMVEAVA